MSMPAADKSRESFSCGSHCQNIIAGTGLPSCQSPGAPFSSATRHPLGGVCAAAVNASPAATTVETNPVFMPVSFLLFLLYLS